MKQIWKIPYSIIVIDSVHTIFGTPFGDFFIDVSLFHQQPEFISHIICQYNARVVICKIG